MIGWFLCLLGFHKFEIPGIFCRRGCGKDRKGLL